MTDSGGRLLGTWLKMLCWCYHALISLVECLFVSMLTTKGNKKAGVKGHAFGKLILGNIFSL